MTTELEQEFFKTFGIEPKCIDGCKVEDEYWDNEELANKYGTFDIYMDAKCGNQENCTTLCKCAYTKEVYPEITDRILLELICILNKFIILNFLAIELKKLKDEILEECIRCMTTPFWNNSKGEQNRKELKHQVQSLFREGEE